MPYSEENVSIIQPLRSRTTTTDESEQIIAAMDFTTMNILASNWGRSKLYVLAE